MKKVKFHMILLYAIIIFLMIPSLSFLLNIKNFKFQELLQILLELRFPLLNTILYCLSVTAISTILGSSLFWLINFHQFSGSNIWKYILFLPMLMPIYITAYADAHFFEYNVNFNKMINFLGIMPLDFRNYIGATLVSSFSLYPYIYILMQAIFKKLQNIIIVSRLNGYSSLKIYFQILFSSARPILIFGISIISMEVISEYGMSNYYGLNNLSNFLYRKWFYAHQYHYASIAAIMIFIIIGIILIFEEKNRQNNQYAANMPDKNISNFYLNSCQSMLSNLYCFIVALMALFIPVGELINLAISRKEYLFSFFSSNNEFLMLVWNSLYLSSIISIMALIMGYTINYLFLKNHHLKKINSALKILITFAYGVPGAFIAISIIIWFNKINLLISEIFPSFNNKLHYLIFGTICGIIYGCLFRFINIAIYTINSGIITQKREINWCKKIYSGSSIKDKINCFLWCSPMYLREVTVVFLVILIDSVKELPITLIMRPFHFSNLTIKAYELIIDERYEEAAIPSLTIIFLLFLISFIFLKIINKKNT